MMLRRICVLRKAHITVTQCKPHFQQVKFGSHSTELEGPRASGLRIQDREVVKIFGSEVVDLDHARNLVKTLFNVQNDATFLNLALKFGKIKLATELLESKTKTSVNINVSEMLVYLRNVPNFSDSVDLKLVESFADKILNMEVISEGALQDLVLGLSGTKRWKEALEIYETKITTPSRACLRSLIVAAVNAWDFSTCFKLLEKSCHSFSTIENSVLEIVVESKVFENLNKTGKHYLELFLKLLAENDIFPSVTVVEKLEQKLAQNGFKISHFKLKNSQNKCQFCSTPFKVQLPLSFREYSRLKGAVIKEVLVGTDVFQKSTPDEVKHFQKFIEETGPFDVVIDGLNTLYLVNVPTRQRYLNLLSVVRYFGASGKKILVIGREHMQKEAKEVIEMIKKESTVYLVKNDSADDPFTIYASLKSGPHCYFVTRDYLRDHMFRLQDRELKDFFVRWKKTRQVKQIDIIDGKLICRPPARQARVAQSSDFNLNYTVHIPYDDGSKVRRDFEPPKTWICASRAE